MNSAPEGWKLVPVGPTAEMVSAAEEAHMTFGDMYITLRMAILSAPDVQGEPVAGGPLHPSQVRALRRNVKRNCTPEIYALLDQAITAPQPAGQDSEQDVAMLLGLLDDCLNSMRNAYPDYDHYESNAYISAMAVFENRTIGRRHGKLGAARAFK